MTDDRKNWQNRPVIAGLVRLGVATVPIVMAMTAVTVAGRVVARPQPVALVLCWWVGLTGLATLVLWLVDRWLRRLLPLIALFKLSLVFPDRAPSRFKTAMRSGSVRQLQRQLESGEYGQSTPQQAAEQLVALAASLNAHDRMTRGHTERVRAYSAMIGEEMGLTGTDLELLNWSGLVHDIGKLAVPTEILNKPGKPTEEEWKVLRDHPARADELVEPLRAWLGQWAESATQHHERFDGKGYPAGLSGSDITLAGRIVAVADAYDVMTSTRSYKKPMPAAEARAELARCAGTQFDPDIVRAFLNLAIGRLRLVMGPLSSLVQFPAGGASFGSAAITGAGAIASVVAVGALNLTGATSEPVEPIPEAVAFVDPEAVDVTVHGAEDEPLQIDLATMIADPIDLVDLVEEPRSGSAISTDSGLITFTPAANFHGTVDVVYRACFAIGTCDVGVVTIVIANINDAPVAEADLLVIDEDTSARVDVTANDSDVDGDRLTVTLAHAVEHPNYGLTAEVGIDDGNVVVSPAADASGSILVEYSVEDPDGAAATATLVVHVTPTADAPVAVPDLFDGYENTAVELDVLANDVDADGDALEITSVSGVNGGVAATDGRSVTFRPHPRYVGPAELSYTITDGTSTATAGVEINVIDITSIPLLNDDAGMTNEDGIAVLDVLANDIALTSTLNLSTMAVISRPSNGTATWTGSDFDYVPEPDWFGKDSFDYFVCDVLEFCNVATATVTVNPVNDAPSFTAGTSVAALEDSGLQTIASWAGDITAGPNEEAQAASFTVVASDPTLFSLAPTLSPAGDLTFSPAPDANGAATLTITLSDDGGTKNGGIDKSTPVTTTITISPVNDAPTFTPGASVVVGEDAGPQALTGWASAITPGPTDEAGQALSFVVTTTNPGLYSAGPAIDPSGQLSFTPSPDANGIATLTITLTDDGGTTGGGVDAAAPVTASVTVTAVNDDPVAAGDSPSVNEDDLVGVTFDALTNDSDIDGDTVQYSGSDLSTVVNGVITDHLDGTFTYIPDEHFNGVESFTYTVGDGNGGAAIGTVNISVLPVADPPVATDDARITLVDTALSVPAPGLLSNDYDVDGEALTVNSTPVSPPTNGIVTLGTDGSYLYTPGPGYVGTDTFSYEISDPGGLTSTATVTVTVDSGVVNQTYYLGDAGAASWAYDLVSAPPPSSAPVYDSDSDGSPGLSINSSSGFPFEANPSKFQIWSQTATATIDLDGPVTLDLWATVKNFDTNTWAHPVVYLYDCLGLSCTLLTQTSVHVGNWNQGVADFVNRQLDLGSVTHTVNPGRDLVVRLQFKHEDMWVAATADYPSALNVTLANQAPIATDDVAAIDEDDPTTNINVLANDTDGDIDPATVTVTSPAGSGTATALGNGTIDYTPDPDTNGVDAFDYQVCDLGGNCDTATVTVTVNAVNDEPTFTGGGAVVAAGLGPNSFPGWASAMNTGAANESGQLLTFVITANDSPALFTAGPAIDPITGELTFDAAGSGVANITIELVDDGGTANGGDDTSTAYAFTITIP